MAEPQLTIAHVSTETGFSGGEVQVFLLMEGLRELGHRNVLFCPPRSRSLEECRKRGIECVTIKMRNDWDGLAAWKLKRGFLRVGADLIHLHTGRATWLGGWAARMAGLPAISTRRMDREVKRNWRTRTVYNRLVQKAVAISPGVSECLRAGGVSPAMTEIISSAVDPSRIHCEMDRQTVRQALRVATDDQMLLAVGTLNQRKGFDVLLEAMRLLEDRNMRPILFIAGVGPERDRLEKLSNQSGFGDRVRWLGRREHVAELFLACDVFVMPSRREGLGVACLEAMGAGRPVVASRVGGLGTTVVENVTGLLVAPGEAAPLAAALARVLEDRDLRQRLGEAGPGRIADGFLPEQMVADYERLYLEVLRARSGTPFAASEGAR